jgi:hypothetical protein
MVSNLLVVLCSEHETQPVVNAGNPVLVADPGRRRWNARRSLLRIDPATIETLRVWAGDDLRSLSGQIQFLLRRALRAAGRLPEAKMGAPWKVR